MKIIPVYEKNGTLHEVMVDDDDFEELNKYSWKWRDGYAVRPLSNGKIFQMHRQIAGVAFKEQVLVDHRDRNHANNTKANLRKANRFENQQNRSTNKGNTLPKGIRQMPSGRYNVRVQSYNKRVTFGSFATIEEAVQARNEYAAKEHGEFYNPSHLIESENNE